MTDNAPACLKPIVKATPMAPTIFKYGTPNNNDMKRTQITCASRCKRSPNNGEIMINGKPVTHHCATIRANINNDPGNGLNNICSMDPSLKSERNKLCNDNKIDNKAAIQITPGPMLFRTVGIRADR